MKWQFQIKLFIQQTCVELAKVQWYTTLKYMEYKQNNESSQLAKV